MRKSVELDHLLENAVATALGLDRPHPQPIRKLRAARPKVASGSHGVARKTHREHVKVAA